MSRIVSTVTLQLIFAATASITVQSCELTDQAVP